MSGVQTCNNNDIYFLHQSCFSLDELDLELDEGEQDVGDDEDDGDSQAEGDDAIGDNEGDGEDKGGRDSEGVNKEGGGDAEDGGSEESDCALGLRGMC